MARYQSIMQLFGGPKNGRPVTSPPGVRGHPPPKRPPKGKPEPTFSVPGIGNMTRGQIVQRYARYGKRPDGTLDPAKAFAAYQARAARHAKGVYLGQSSGTSSGQGTGQATAGPGNRGVGPATAPTLNPQPPPARGGSAGGKPNLASAQSRYHLILALVDRNRKQRNTRKL